MTSEQHNKFIAFSFIGYGALQLLMLLIIGAVMFLVFTIDDPRQPPPPKEFFSILFAFMAVFQLAFAVPSFIAAYGLLKQKSWARLASIIAAVTASMSVPIGTAVCVYTFWYFLGEQWKSIYEQPGENPGRPPYQIAAGDESNLNSRLWENGYSYQDPPDWR